MELDKIIYAIKNKGYNDINLYVEDDKIRFLMLKSLKSHSSFLLSVPNTIPIFFNIGNEEKNIINEYLILDENPKLKNQLVFLKNIKINEWSNFEGINGPGLIPGICCKTKNNIYLKLLIGEKEFYINYLISKDTDIQSRIVGHLYPVFNILYFNSTKTDIFESVLDNITLNMAEQEENYNEKISSNLIESVEKLKKNVKENLYEINKKTFNIRRDILKHNEGLNKLLTLKQESLNKKDTIRFKIERLIMETEEKIDELNNSLLEQRNKVNNIVNSYNKWINKGLALNI